MSLRKLIAIGTTLVGTLMLGACDKPTTTEVRLSPSDQASRIVHGTLDGNNHRAVVLIVMDIAGDPAFRCSGTLLSARVVLTAGHCTGEPGEFSGMRVFTEADVDNGNNNYPFPGPNTVEAKSWASHPLFTEALFFLHDVGVIVLNKDVPLPASAYGVLPGVNQLDGLKSNANTTFTSVGYGLQRINPVKLIEERVRMFAEPHLIQINTPSTGPGTMLLSNNASTGGICFGDSGGPNYLGSSNVVAGVTSFGRNGNCAGTGGVFRVDRRDVIDFVSAFLK
jgi:V8-like Glu-specific endopeptidase